MESTTEIRYRMPVKQIYHVIENRNDGLKRMQVLTEGGVEVIDEGCWITHMNLS